MLAFAFAPKTAAALPSTPGFGAGAGKCVLPAACEGLCYILNELQIGVSPSSEHSLSLSLSLPALHARWCCNDMCINFSWTIRFSVRQDGFITVRLRCKQIPFSQRPLFAFLTSQRCKVQRSTNAVQKTNLHRWFAHYVTVVGVDSLKLL